MQSVTELVTTMGMIELAREKAELTFSERHHHHTNVNNMTYFSRMLC